MGGPGNPEGAAPRTGDRPPYQDTAPILVAVEDNANGWEPLEWAAAEAAARPCVLRILHAITWPLLTVDAFGSLWVNQLEAGAAEAAELVVNEAASHARMIAPDVEVTTHLQAGPTAKAVLREGRHDALIVLGRERRDRRLSPFTRSVTWQVARHASCPVAVVELLNRPSRGPSAGRVVVRVAGAEEPPDALDFAFRAARRRGVGITALRTSSPPIPVDLNAQIPVDLDAQNTVDLDVQIPDPAVAESDRRRTVEDAVQLCRVAFPEVDVRQRLVAAPAGPALVAESAGAALVVLSSRAHSWSDRVTVESVERTVLRSAHSPVAIVNTPRANRGQSGRKSST